MAIVKVETCPKCKKKLHIDKMRKINRDCPRCGTRMYYSKKWYKSFTKDGKLHFEAVSENKRVAEDALAKDRVNIRENRYFDKAASISWSHVIKDFDAWIDNNVRANTKRMYLNSLKILSPHFSGYTLDKITPQMVEVFKKDRLAAGKEPTTINRDLATIKRIFALAETEWVTKEGQPYIEVNRIRKVKLLSEKENKRIRYLTEDEIERLLWATRCPLAHGNPRKHIITLLALETGQRKESIFSLKRHDVDFKENVIRFVVKGGKRVTVDMTERLKVSLKYYLNSQKVIRPYIFPSEQVTGRVGVEDACLRNDADFGFWTALKRAQITGFRFHDLRHTFATIFFKRTKNWKALQVILGHEDISTTMNRYTHLMDDDRKKAMKEYDNYAQ